MSEACECTNSQHICGYVGRVVWPGRVASGVEQARVSNLARGARTVRCRRGPAAMRRSIRAWGAAAWRPARAEAPRTPWTTPPRPRPRRGTGKGRHSGRWAVCRKFPPDRMGRGVATPPHTHHQNVATPPHAPAPLRAGTPNPATQRAHAQAPTIHLHRAQTHPPTYTAPPGRRTLRRAARHWTTSERSLASYRSTVYGARARRARTALSVGCSATRCTAVWQRDGAAWRCAPRGAAGSSVAHRSARAPPTGRSVAVRRVAIHGAAV
jgi:hypothetical protein